MARLRNNTCLKGGRQRASRRRLHPVPMYQRCKRAGLLPAVGSSVILGLSMFKGLRQADQHSAYERGIILREGVHDLQSSLARRTHGSLHFPCVGTECLLHLRACFGSPLRDIVENGFPLPFGAAARVLGGLLDAVEELFFKRLELLESLFLRSSPRSSRRLRSVSAE